jgi:hypothetical protein
MKRQRASSRSRRIGISLIPIVALFATVATGLGAAPPWSSWEPESGSTAAVSKRIAARVEGEYRLTAGGGPLVAVVANEPEVRVGTRRFDVSYIAARARNGTARSATTANTWMYELCGRGPHCSIPGTASLLRGRLVRREALELALDTFEFVPSIGSVAVLLPPPPGLSTSTLLYLERTSLHAQLSRPLRKTLTSVLTPLPDDLDSAEAATIDRLTVLADYAYFVRGLADGTAVRTLELIG